MTLEIAEKQKIEVEFWKNSKHESPTADSVYNIVNKMSEAKIWLSCLDEYQDILVDTGRVLELGAGQGWASCLYKKKFPNVESIVTDISKYAIASLGKWEHILKIKIDKSYACKSYEIQEEDNSVDQIICFAAAHHFLSHKKTLKEIHRVLKPGGKAFYFYEPCSSRLMYRPAFYRVNRKRPEVPEDVLITDELRKIAQTVGLDFQIDYYPSLQLRGAVETIYFFILGKFTFLQKLLPATGNFIFTKIKS